MSSFPKKKKVIGVIPEFLANLEIVHPGLSETHLVQSMHERKKIMYEKADLFVILPGGFGTLDEFFEALTWTQLGLHQRPILVFNSNGYYKDLRELLATMVANGFAKQQHRDLVTFVDDLAQLKYALQNRDALV